MAFGLWNKDASPRQKAVNIAVLSLSCLTIYGASASILVFNDVAARLNWLTLVMTAFIIVGCLCCWLFDLVGFRQGLRYRIEYVGAFKATFALMFMPFLIYVACYAVLVCAIPSLLHHMISQPAELLAVISDKPYRFSDRRQCDGLLYIEGFDYVMANELCGVHEDDWNRMSVGTVLFLQGQQSVFGFSVEEYSYFAEELPAS